jgi:alpha-glucosidase
VVRPTFFDFPDDPHCWREGDEMMVGPSLLAAPVVEPGHVHREVYLPFGAHWYDFWSGEVFKGVQTITRPAPWTWPVLPPSPLTSPHRPLRPAWTLAAS